ncbi:PREDICTED: transcription factor 24 [Elephantulus edwardii]|uniref:transcription factor 24 n=1 Tax=Elephantulus edwardii TaxID=28737 RepID=UPI0003F0995B|nr:PREDICTED: transcription factor 24 [Elephantulus edwardii]
MDRDGSRHAGTEPEPSAALAARDPSPGRSASGGSTRSAGGRPAAANAARERSRVQTLRHAFLELQRTLPSVPPDTKLSKLDVLLLATTYIAHLTRSLQDDAETPAEPGLGTLRGDGYLHPVKVGAGAERSRSGAPRPSLAPRALPGPAVEPVSPYFLLPACPWLAGMRLTTTSLGLLPSIEQPPSKTVTSVHTISRVE